MDDHIALSGNLDKMKNISMATYILVTMFGIGSWVAMNGIWVELPNLVDELPEGWRLPSYLTIICQLGNIGPIIYSLLEMKFIHSRAKLLRVVVYITLNIGILACILLAVFWQNTVVLLNKNVSVALLTFTFLLALVDCTSSVTFLPFMAILPGFI